MTVKFVLASLVMAFVGTVYADLIMPEPLHRIGFEVLVYAAGAAALGGGFVWKLKNKVEASGCWKTEDELSHGEREDVIGRIDENLALVQKDFDRAYETALPNWMDEDGAKKPSCVFYQAEWRVNRERVLAWRSLQQQLLIDVLAQNETLLERLRGVPIEWLCDRVAKPMPDGFTAGIFVRRLIAGRYLVVRQLALGEGNTSYLCHDEVTGINVVVKALPSEMTRDSVWLESIQRVFMSVSSLCHPGIVPVRSIEISTNDFPGGDFFLVEDYVPGVPISQWRRQFPGHKVPFEKALDVVRQVAAALDYAHAENVFHGNLKPSNVMIEAMPDGTLVVRVLDFELRGQMRSPVQDRQMGSCPYKSPEQLQGHPWSAQSDLYSLGVMAYEMIAGHLPQYNGDVEPIDGASPHINTALVRVMMTNPDARFGNCFAFAKALGGEVPLCRFAGLWRSLRRHKV